MVERLRFSSWKEKRGELWSPPSSTALMFSISSAIGSNTRIVHMFESMMRSISNRSSSHLNSASSYWFLRICLNELLSSDPMGMLTQPSLSTFCSSSLRSEHSGRG